jgi:hypothetical protein
VIFWTSGALFQSKTHVLQLIFQEEKKNTQRDVTEKAITGDR